MGSISFQNSTTNHEEDTKTRMYDCIDFDVRILPDQPGRWRTSVKPGNKAGGDDNDYEQQWNDERNGGDNFK